MHTETLHAFNKAVQETIALIKPVSEQDLNTRPHNGGWTAAQVARHLVKAGKGMPELFAKPAPAANRQPDEKAEELKEILLNFDLKMTSPDFIIPEDKNFPGTELIKDMESILTETGISVNNANMAEIPQLEEGNPLKGYTKLELLHFALYHTQRHNRQISEVLGVAHKG